MKNSQPPRLPLALLEWFVSDSTPLAGDLVEEFGRRRSLVWLWRQVLAAIATAAFARPDTIRPLRLVDLQPADAQERSRQMSVRFKSVNLSASPLPGVGGLGLVALSLLVSVVMPGAWWALLASTLAGIALGVVLIAMHRRSSD